MNRKILSFLLVLALAAVMPLSALAETTEADAGAPAGMGQPPEGDFPGEPPEGGMPGGQSGWGGGQGIRYVLHRREAIPGQPARHRPGACAVQVHRAGPRRADRRGKRLSPRGAVLVYTTIG